MPISYLNKTLNVLLQGLLTLCVAAAIWASYAPKATRVEVWADMSQIATGVAAFSILLLATVALLIGTVVDRLGERFFLTYIERACIKEGSSWLLSWTRSDDSHASFLAYRIRVKAALKESKWNSATLPWTDEGIFRAAVEGIVFRSGSKEALDWIIQHYSLARLSCGFSLVLLAGVPPLAGRAVWYAGAGTGLFLVGIGLVLLYGLVTTAVDQCLYSYIAILTESLGILVPLNPKGESK